MSEAKVHQFKVVMTCESCSNAVERVLGKLKGKGVEDVTVSLEHQTAEVTTTLPMEHILETIKKTGKEVTFIATK